MLSFYQVDSQEQTSAKFESKHNKENPVQDAAPLLVKHFLYTWTDINWDFYETSHINLVVIKGAMSLHWSYVIAQISRHVKKWQTCGIFI